MNARARSRATERQDHVSANSSTVSSTMTSDNQNFMYLHVGFSSKQISALLDTGSSINLMSQELFDSISTKHKLQVERCDESIVLANNQTIAINCVAEISAVISGQQQSFTAYVLQGTSHPLILGTEYMRTHGVTLNFDKMSVHASSAVVRSKKKIILQPNSETFTWGKTPKCLSPGLEGICSGSIHVSKKCLFVARSVSVVSSENSVPLKILNPTGKPVIIHKNKPLGSFQVMDNSFNVTPADPIGHVSSLPQQGSSTPSGSNSLGNKIACNHVNMAPMSSDKSSIPEGADRERFLSYFHQGSTTLSLSIDEKKRLDDCLVSNHDLFVTEENPSLGLTSVVEHQIHLIPNAESKHQRPYRLSPDKKEVLRHQLDELLQQGIITPVSEKEDIPISSPIVLVSKRNKPKPGIEPGSREASLSMYRFCVDFRFLNSQTQDFRYAIPDVQDLTESFTQKTPNFISSIDLSSGFFQMKLSSDASKFTAFNTCFGTYKFLRLPQGLKTSPNSFQLLMDKILSGLSFRSTLCYLDDVLTFSETFDQHLSDLQEVFDRFRSAGLKISPGKCHFAERNCVFLGHNISKDGISPPSDRLKAVSDYPVPKNAKQLKRYLGLMNWFKKYIPRFSAKAHCLYKLLKKNVAFAWKDEHSAAFETMKASLLESEALAFPRYDLPFYLGVDTSSKGIGYMLYQKHPQTDGDAVVRVVRFGSKALSHYQTSYGPTKLELLGVVTSILDCASYLRGRKFFVECDHQALKPLFQKSLKGAIYERWLAILQEFNFEISYKPAESMVVCDSLSRAHPVHSVDSAESSPNEIDPYFPFVPEQVNEIMLPNGSNLQDMISTGQSNQQKSVNHVSIPPTSLRSLHDNDSAYDGDTDLPQVKSRDSRRRSVPHGKTQGKLLRPFVKTQSHRHAANPQLLYSDAESDTQSSVRTEQSVDTDCVQQNTSQIANNDSTRHFVHTTDHSEGSGSDANRALAPDNFSEYTGSTSSVSDEQSSQSATPRDNRSLENVDLFKSFDFSPDKISALQREDCELQYLVRYLETNELPRSQKRARKLLLQSADYCMIDGILFHSRVAKSQRSSSMSHYQLVVPEIMIKTVLSLYHDSPMGGHSGIQDTLDRVKEHYFFPRMSQLVTDYVRSCPSCQKRKQTQVRTRSGVTAYKTPNGPFQVWQIDLYGNLPITPQGYTYILTATDMFSKYLVTIPLANKDTLSVASGLTQLFTKYGVCDTLLSDVGSENISKCMAQVCRQLCIPQEFSPAFVHKCLGAVERAHRTMAERLTPYMNNRLNNWIDVLSSITFSINQSVHSDSKYSPHEIVFGQRPKFPLSPPTPTDFETIPPDMHTYVRKHAEKLQVIRSEVKNNILLSQQKMLERANKDANPLHIKEGDYVFLSTERTGVGQKLQNAVKGPYVIHHCVSPHMYVLRNPENGTIHKLPVHIDRLRMAYVREPEPTPYFLSKVVTAETVQPVKVTEATPRDVPAKEPRDQSDDGQLSALPHDNITNDPTVRRSSRTRKPPDRFGVYLDVDSALSDEGVFTDRNKYHKIKRVLGQRSTNGNKQYLIQFAGESADNSIWVPFEHLNEKLQKSVQSKPPPVIVQIEQE